MIPLQFQEKKSTLPNRYFLPKVPTNICVQSQSTFIWSLSKYHFDQNPKSNSDDLVCHTLNFKKYSLRPISILHQKITLDALYFLLTSYLC